MAGELAVKATMEAIADALETVPSIEKAWPYPREGVANTKHAVVGYPRFTLGSGAFRRVLDKATFTVLVLAGLAGAEETMTVVDEIISGAVDVKDAIEAGLDDVAQFVNVTGGAVERVILEVLGKRIAYAAVRFDVEVTA